LLCDSHFFEEEDAQYEFLILVFGGVAAIQVAREFAIRGGE